MSRSEIKKWAKEKVTGHRIDLLVAIIISSIVTNLSLNFGNVNYTIGDSSIKAYYTIPLGFIFAFVAVGFARYMFNFIEGKAYNVNDLFQYRSIIVKALVTKLLENIFIALWTLLFIVPGVIKYYAYSLVDIILADEKYNDLSYTDILAKSSEIMNGHKMDLFMLDLSFIGNILLGVITCGIYLIYALPYMTAARYKFLYDLVNESN